MSRIKPNELRKKSEKELRETLLKEKQHLRDLYFRLSGAQLKNVHEIKATKRSIATVITLIREKKKNE